ncbi:hypothetical protein ISX56_33495, partial [Serratia ureilytica]|nr:hypothetical protein [Serratia ureilytica]
QRQVRQRVLWRSDQRREDRRAHGVRSGGGGASAGGQENRQKRALRFGISNADKFTHRGAIILNVKVCHGNLYLWVKDNGIGFNVNNLERLYKAFNQGVERETRRSGVDR